MITTSETGMVKYGVCLIGKLSADNFTFILYRHSFQLVRKHDAYGMSKSLATALFKKGCRMLIIAINGEHKYRIKMETFIKEGIEDKLWKQQEDHIFFPKEKLELIR